MSMNTTEAEHGWEVTPGGTAYTLPGLDVGVTVEDGVATLTGRVETRDEKLAAERAALKLPGVAAVADEVIVAGSGSRGVNDTEIARAVLEHLRKQGLEPPNAVRACVEQGWVTLTGEVDLFHQRDALERGVRNLPGVLGATDLVKVRPPESQTDIDTKVQSAVSRELESLDPEAAARRRSDEMESTMAQGKKVLIIDDDGDFRASLKPVLEGAGYVVVEAVSGHEGLARVVEHDPDVIVVDIMMETNEEGYGVNQAIKYQDAYEAYRNTPILMVSSIQETPDDRFPRAVELDMIRPDAYFTKPLDFDRFLDAVKKAATRRRRK